MLPYIITAVVSVIITALIVPDLGAVNKRRAELLSLCAAPVTPIITQKTKIKTVALL